MKLKRSSIEQTETESPSGEGAFISARLRNPEEQLRAEASAASKTDLVGGICAVVATVLLLLVTVLLYMNWEAIKSS